MAQLTLLMSSLLLFCCGRGSFLMVRPGEQRLRAYSTANITCYFSSCSEVNWRGPALTRHTNRISIQNYSRRSQLSIHNLVEEDEGQYSCVCDGRPSTHSTLIVTFPPHFGNVSENQTFERGTHATIVCEAFPGDPLHEMQWFRISDTYRAVEPSDRYRMENDILIIIDINDEDMGLYQCGFHTVNGFVAKNITVNVHLPQQQPWTIVGLEPEVHVHYNDPLELTCNTAPDNIETNISWLTRDQRITNQTLSLQPREYATGSYICTAACNQRQNNYIVYVVVDTPPIFPQDFILDPIEAIEGENISLHLHFEAEVENNTNLQWKKIIDGRKTIVNFDSRSRHTVSGTSFRLSIKNIQVADNGTYELNISNPFGYAVLEVTLQITQLPRTTLQILFTGPICEWVQSHEPELIKQLKKAVNRVRDECQNCNDITVIAVNCTEDRDAARVTVTLKSQEELPLPDQVNFQINGSRVMAIVCGNDCTTTIAPTTTTTTTTTQAVIATLTIGLVVVSITVVILGFTLLRRRYCRNQKVAQGEAPHMEQAPEQPPVIQQRNGFVGHAEQVNLISSATSTPPSVPFPIQPLPPLQMPLMITNGQEKRPKRLFSRSNSYHGSTRT